MLVKLHCNACISTFNIEFVEPAPKRELYLYCPACASEKVQVSQYTTEEYSFLVLAKAYNMPIAWVTKLYAAWMQEAGPIYFKDYVIQQLEKLVPSVT